MNFAFPAKALACGGLLLGISLSSSGLTLGRAQGAAFVGKPLDLRVQLQLDGSDDTPSACLGVEVFYGDSQVDPARVSVHLEPSVAGSAPQGAVARVQSSVLINEPIVTVSLRAGCQQQRSFRRYTLFPDVVTNLVAAPPVAAVQRPAPVPVDLPEVVGTGSPSAPAPAAQRSSTSRKSRAALTAELPQTTAKRPPVVAKAQPSDSEVRLPKPKKTQATGKPRLKLDTLDLLIERDPVLQASSEMAAPPQEDPQKRAEAAALWKSLNASPEEMMREDAKAMAVARELKSLYAVTNENQKGLMDLAAQVQRAESERYANWLVYSLVALVVLSMAALVWTVSRLRAVRKPSWSQGLDAGDSLMVELVQDRKASRKAATASSAHLAEQPPVAPAPAVVVPVAAPEQPAPAPTAEVDFDLDLMLPPVQQQPPRADAAVPPPTLVLPAAGAAHGAAVPSKASLSHPWVRDFSISVAGGMRAIDSEELMDVRQQADFFMSLGEHQKAVDILTTRIAQCGESSPLVCLDLLKIYHALGRESEYEFMRTEFNNWFTGRVPAFSSFGDEGHALEHYPQVVSEIVALWPDPRVLEYIESCIYHHANDADWSDFDLHAFRDLLLLHGVAKRIVRNASDAADSHAAELVRIPARVPIAAVGMAPDRGEHNGFVHRAGAHYRGAWKHNTPKKPAVPPHGDVDPQADIETRGAPLGAMKVPPSATTRPITANPSGSAPDGGEQGPVTDFNFLNLR